MMSARLRGTVAIVAIVQSSVIAGLPADGGYAAEERVLLEWATRFRARSGAICERVSVPSRYEAEERIRQAIDTLEGKQRAFMNKSLESLGEIPGRIQPGRVGVAWGPSLELEVSRRQTQLLKAWDRCRKDCSLDRVIKQARKYGNTVEGDATEWRTRVLKNEARLAQMERASRERILSPRVRRYALNWLLGGHPEAFVPPEWTRVAKRSRPTSAGGQAILTGAVSVTDEFHDMRTCLRHLEGVLVAVGLGDFGPEYLIQIERGTKERRRGAHRVLVALTGEHLSGSHVQLAKR